MYQFMELFINYIRDFEDVDFTNLAKYQVFIWAESLFRTHTTSE